jgi:hypothetical protein
MLVPLNVHHERDLEGPDPDRAVGQGLAVVEREGRLAALGEVVDLLSGGD